MPFLPFHMYLLRFFFSFIEFNGEPISIGVKPLGSEDMGWGNLKILDGWCGPNGIHIGAFSGAISKWSVLVSLS